MNETDTAFQVLEAAIREFLYVPVELDEHFVTDLTEQTRRATLIRNLTFNIQTQDRAYTADVKSFLAEHVRLVSGRCEDAPCCGCCEGGLM